jgi:hypothetical protein
MISAMNPLAAFTMLITVAQSLASAVSTRDDLHLRPETARKTVAMRLRSGLILLRAFLRRLILLIALDLEWGLMDKRGEMKRPHGRTNKKPSAPITLDGLYKAKVGPWQSNVGPHMQPQNKAAQRYGNGGTPVFVEMAKLYAQLDFLAKVAADPYAKAKRLAFHMARTREGLIFAPYGPKRIAGRWGTEVSSLYDVMAFQINEKSRNRPPPLPPPRTHWPMITAL